MSKIVYKLIFDRKKCLNRYGMGLVQIEACQGKQKKYFSTHVYLLPHQWDIRKQLVRNHPNAEALNHLIHQYIADVERKELQLWKRGKPVSLEMLKAELEGVTQEESFIDFFAREVKDSDVKESTRNNQLSTWQLLRGFRPSVLFSDLTFDFVADFELYLRRRGYHTNTIAKHIKHLRRQVNAAVNKGFLEEQHNPFRNYRIKMIPGRHTHLTPEELTKLELFHPLETHRNLYHVLDAFLFCCYAGLRYSDFTSLSPANIVDIGQERWLIYHSVKTGTEVRLPLFVLFGGKALGILEKYQNRLEDFFRLGDNSNTNKRLRLIGQMAGVDTPISFHTARHTNATLLIYNGVNITTVQKLLGHKSVRTTQIYANVMDQTLVHDLRSHSL